MIVDIKPKSYEMTSNTKNEINMSKTLNILNKVIGMVNKSEFINQIYSDLEGGEIEIYQADPATYAVGDKTSMEEGEVVLDYGSKLTIVEGKIAEINRSADADAEAAEEVEAAEFNEGEAPKMEEEVSELEEMIDEPKMDGHEEGEEEAPIEPIEEEEAPAEAPKKKDDMPSVVIETTEQIITTKETVAVEVEAEAIEVEAKEEVMEEEVEMKEEEVMEMEPKMDGHSEEEMMDEPKMEEEEVMEEEEMKEYVSMDEYNSLKERMEILEAKLGDYENKFEAISKFENIATEAIDTLASNTVSTFKPEAKAVSTPSSANGSIFSQLKNKRGL
jgi:hypothetical protein